MFRLRTVATIAIGFGAGYIVGTKAGRPAYDRLVASLNEAAGQLGLTRAVGDGQTSGDATNDELANLRETATVGVPGQPDQGRKHAAIPTPTPTVAQA